MLLPRRLHYALMASASACALASPALAQDEPAPAVTEEAPPGEIVVTATRQEQLLSRVPISVSAFGQESLDAKGAKSIADVARFTPGLTFDDTSNAIAIRGISSGAGAGTTGIYLDETPVQIRNLGFASDNSLPAIFDLERIEVLRGPQGTLFGAGSEGGTVRYITPQPGFQDFDVYARAEVSSTAHGGTNYEGGVAVGGPIVPDVLGFRVSGWYRHDAGWVDKADSSGAIYDSNTNGGWVGVVHGALAWRPVDDLTITPAVHYQKRVTDDDAAFTRALSDPEHGTFIDTSPEYRRNTDRFVLPSLKVEYDFEAMTLISNTSYFDRHNISGYDGTVYDLSYYQSLLETPFLTATGLIPELETMFDGGPYVSPSRVTNDQRIWTQEVRLQSSDPDATVTWVAGVFFQKQRQMSREELVDPFGNDLFLAYSGQTLEEWFTEDAGLDPSNPDELLRLYDGIDSYINESVAHERQIAGFADVTWHLTEQLSVTGGARLAHLTYRFENFADGPQQYGRAEASGKTSNTPFTPKLNVSYQADRDNLFYATYARGVRPAGANALIPPGACEELPDGGGRTQFSPDTVDSYELGSKNRLFDRRLSLAASVYSIKWKGIQNYVYLPSCAIQFIDNLGTARSQGFDLQLNAAPIDGISVDFAIGYTHARYTKDAISDQVGLLASKGDAIPGIAPWTISLGAQYDFALGGDTDGYVRYDWEYASELKRRTPQQNPDAISYNPDIARPTATHFLSARAGVRTAGIDVSLFIDNILDSSPLIDEADNDSDFFTRETWQPRTVGVTASYRM
jgi:outer membrane receptor protein involved in Fe transport